MLTPNENGLVLVREIEPKPLVREHSCSPVAEDLGVYASTMELWWYSGSLYRGSGSIEWEIPGLDDGESIGIWTEDGALVDYDGTICELNPDMIQLLQDAGITVPEEFTSD